MVLPGHIAGGYIATAALLSVLPGGLSLTEWNSLLVVGTLAGELPDIDLLAFYFEQKSSKPNKIENHHEYITHFPLFWLVISLAISLGGLLSESLFVLYLGFVILLGSWTHLFLDTIDYRIKWLWPINEKWFSIRNTPQYHPTHRPGTLSAHYEFVIKSYLKTTSFYVEAALSIWALLLFF